MFYLLQHGATKATVVKNYNGGGGQFCGYFLGKFPASLFSQPDDLIPYFSRCCVFSISCIWLAKAKEPQLNVQFQ